MASFRAKIFRFRAIYIVIFTFHAGIFAYIYGIPFLDLMELKTVDLRFESRGPIRPGQETPYAGSFTMKSDPDGVVRRMPAVIQFQDALYPPLSLMAVSAYRDEEIAIKISEAGVETLRIGELSIPTDELGQVFINYRGGPKTFPHVSVTDILHGDIPDAVFRNKIVFVGVTATGAYDLRVTPYASVFPGIEIHGNVADMVLEGDFLRQPAWAALFDLLAIGTVGLMLGLILPRVGALWGAAVTGLVFSGYVLLCYTLFVRSVWILNMVYPLSVLLVSYVGLTGYTYLTEARQKRFIRSAFSTYLAPSVVKQLIESPDRLELGGEQRVITAFFSDVEGFTPISESLAPSELVELLNEFLTEMTDIIFDHAGTVDKFEGDAIIAFFGAPNDLPDHAAAACRTAVDMQSRLAQLRDRWRVRGRPLLKMRIGLCSGSAVVGNMGSKNRMDYTMMGDTVNTAARLEGINKIYGVYTLIGETTYRTLNQGFVVREIDSVRVAGKEQPVGIYELIGYPETIDGGRRETLNHYADGLNRYRQQDWDGASAAFQKALDAAADDGPSRVLLDRCRFLKMSPPPPDWDGVYDIRTK